MNVWQHFVKRGFDLCLAILSLILFGWLIFPCWLIATIDTKQNGLYTQERVGKNGKKFNILKIRTMRVVKGFTSVVTQRGDPRVTRIGAILRRLKLDELPQLINVLLGQMSFVGPRPDVVGFADLLQGEDAIILTVRPGITGPATLFFRNEEELLANSADPERYNREVLFVTKVRLNREYLENYSFFKDIMYIIATVVPRIQSWFFPELKFYQDVERMY